jgi:hypothetical protein
VLLSVKDIVTLKGAGVIDLRALASQGEPDAVRNWLAYSAWAKIQASRNIPPAKRVDVFAALHSELARAEVNVEVVHGR